MRDGLKLLGVMAIVVFVLPTASLDLQRPRDGTLRSAGGDGPSHGALRARSRARPWLRQRQGESTLQYELCPGGAAMLLFDVYLPPAPLQADVLFAFDTTLSMGEVISTGQDRAIEIMSDLQNLIGDVTYGLVDFRDYPQYPYGLPSDWPYRLRQPLTRDASHVRSEIEQLESQGGWMAPEAYTRVLYEAYADERINWRSGARRFLVMFGDSVPHDDDLNEGIPAPQPFRPDERWISGAYPAPHLDPGRDGESGTHDDLDFQPVLGALRGRSIALLFVLAGLSDGLPTGLTSDALQVYWQAWAAMTGPGGNARALEDVDNLPAVIQELVTNAIRHIDQLAVSVAPSWYTDWVTVDPPEYSGLDIPAEGLHLTFEVTVRIPSDMPAGAYVLVLLAQGDGAVYDRQQVNVTVPESCFARPTPTWAPRPPSSVRRLLYIPLVANNYTARQHSPAD